MNTPTPIRHALIPLALLSLAACGQARSQTRADETRELIAMATVATDSPGAYRAAPVPARLAAAVPEDVLRDPAARFALMDQLRTQVVSKTRRVPEARWRGEVRPALRHQLESAGLSRGDVDFLLWEIDQAKAAPVQ